MNGMSAPNGNMPGAAAGAAAAMAVGPTPAGHQAELNIIYSMVEDLSRQLAENRRVTEDIVSSVGRVRNRGGDRNMTYDEILGEAGDEIFAQENNMDTLISILTEALDRAKHSRDANFTLVTSYARVLSQLLSQFHAYKQKHVSDVSAWHRSYRAQLAEERAENSRLREQILDMQEHAGRANELLRDFRKKFDDNESRMDRRVEDKARKQEIRFWKRLAMPDVGDDDSSWSDDDDLIDPAEKERLRDVERKVELQALSGMGGADGQQVEDAATEDAAQELQGLVGGVAMERESSGGSAVNMGMMPPPARPQSTGSTGGQAG